MDNQQFDLEQKYSRNTLGNICEINNSVHINTALNQVEKFFNTHQDCHAIPVKSEAGIIGIVERHRIFCQIRKRLGNLVGSSLKDFVNVSPLRFNANENIEYALSVIVQESNAGEIHNVLIDQSANHVLGTINVRQLILHIMDMRRGQLVEAVAIQNSLIGCKSISEPFLNAEIAVEMAYELGGDFSQLIQLSQGKYLITCFDVSGKNLSAAIYTGLIAGFFSTLEVTGLINSMNTEDILIGLNRLLLEKTPGEIFVTAVLVHVDAVAKRMEIYNCGYGNVYISSAVDSRGFRKFAPTLPPLGLDSIWEPLSGKEEFAIIKGSRLFTFSDGISDAKNQHGEQYGGKQVSSFIERNWAHSGKDFFASFLDSVHSFIGHAVRVDDITMMMLQF